jgi:hypothetical protein
MLPTVGPNRDLESEDEGFVEEDAGAFALGDGGGAAEPAATASLGLRRNIQVIAMRSTTARERIHAIRALLPRGFR